MRTTDTIIIGAGQAGLAASRHLSEHGHDHVVLERGHTAQRWTSATWDSLRLLTPNWMNRLPAWDYRGPDSDGYMAAAEFAAHLVGYAHSFGAPVEEGSSVRGLRRLGDGFEVVTDRGRWRADSVVVATGWCDEPAIPATARQLDPSVHQLAPGSYRNPGTVPDGGVLVVGASATGVQLADELRAAGRDVTLAVGSHSRLPRHYRGMDIFWWLGQIGAFDKTIDEMADAQRARHAPSLQLVGRPDRRSLDLGTLQEAGVELVGRVSAADGRHIRLAADLHETVAAADRSMRRVLRDIDDHIERQGLSSEVLEADRVPSIAVRQPAEAVDLRAAGIRTVIWATGHRRRYPWLHIPVLDAHGEIRQRRGVTRIPGLYVLGQRFQHHRNSNFIGGVGRDAAYVTDHILSRRTATLTCH
jgi:putative flavoprotein involved in K+ transport